MCVCVCVCVCAWVYLCKCIQVGICICVCVCLCVCVCVCVYSILAYILWFHFSQVMTKTCYNFLQDFYYLESLFYKVHLTVPEISKLYGWVNTEISLSISMQVWDSNIGSDLTCVYQQWSWWPGACDQLCRHSVSSATTGVGVPCHVRVCTWGVCSTLLWLPLLWAHGGVVWTEKVRPPLENPERSKVPSTLIRGRPEYSRDNFICCQEFCFSNFCHPSPSSPIP